MFSIINFIKFHLPPIIWGLTIYFASSFPGSKVHLIEGLDKLIHFTVYGIFCFLIHRSFQNIKSDYFFRNSLLLAVIATSIYGLSDELHQAFVPQRSAEFADFVADFSGAIFYILIYKKFLSKIK